VIFPAANISRTFFLSIFISPFSSLGIGAEPLQGFFNRQFAAGQLFKYVEVRSRSLKALIEHRADGVESVLDRGITDAKQRLHLLNRPVMPHKGDDECLIVRRQLAQWGYVELALDGDGA